MGGNSFCLKNMSGRHSRFGELHTKICTVFLPFRVYFACYPPKSFKEFAWLVFGWNLSIQAFILHKICSKSLLCRLPYFSVFKKSVHEANNWLWDWNEPHNWLNLLTSCGPSLEAIGRNAIFYEFFSFLGPEVPIFAGT